MQKGMNIFIAVYAVLLVAVLGAAIALPDKPEVAQYAAGAMGLVMFAMAYIAHRASEAVGNPFNGLVWGSFGTQFKVFIGAVVVAVLAVGIAVGLGFTSIDPDMGWFVESVRSMSAEKGQPLPDNAIPMMLNIWRFSSYLGPVFGAPFLAALFVLSFLPVYGWLGRRLLTKGLPTTLAVMAGFGLLSSLSGAFVKNPMFETHNPALAIPVSAVYGVALTLVLFWLFLSSNSAVVPAYFLAVYSSVVGSAQFYFSDPQAHMVPPTGLADMIVLVILAAGLWLYKVPDWKRMEVAGVSFDGTSLTSGQLEQLEAGRSARSSGEPDPQAAPTEATAGEAEAETDDSTVSAG
ncbi:MAG: hypothetical protein R3F46_03880 [bacterium]